MRDLPPLRILIIAGVGGLLLAGMARVLQLGWLDWFATLLMFTAAMFVVGYRAGRRQP